jgi:hypothetical protein
MLSETQENVSCCKPVTLSYIIHIKNWQLEPIYDKDPTFIIQCNKHQKLCNHSEICTRRTQKPTTFKHPRQTPLTQEHCHVFPLSGQNWIIWDICTQLHTCLQKLQVRVQNFIWSLFSSMNYTFPSVVPRNFFRGGGSTNSVEDRGQTERGSGGGSPLVRGSTRWANEWNPYSDYVVMDVYSMELGIRLSFVKFRNFGSGEGGWTPKPSPPLDTPLTFPGPIAPSKGMVK